MVYNEVSFIHERGDPMPFDLHCHSRLSDGSMEIEDIVFWASAIGLSGIAVTDHDTMDGVERAEKAAKKGFEIIPGIELSCYDEKRRRKVHILCYYPIMTDELRSICDEMNLRRKTASEEMLQRVQKLYPISEQHVARIGGTSTVIYKPHIMQALMDMGYTSSIYGELYKILFDPQVGSCSCRPRYTDVYAALAAAHRAGAVVCLAHPGVYRSFELLEELCGKCLLDGVEYRYPRQKEGEAEILDRLINQFGLIPTAGTDFHGFYTPRTNPIGTCVASKTVIDRIKELKKSKEV